MILDIKEYLPQREYSIIQKASELLETLGIRGYLVGGIVRDMLLCRINIDIDITIEGDGISFAQKLGEILKGETTVYSQFSYSINKSF